MLDFEARLAERWSPAQWADVTVVLAVSGGADSVAMFRAVLALKQHFGGAGRLIVGHFNHRLRGGEAEADEQFVRRLCTQFDVACEVERAAEGSIAPGGEGLELAARKARYEFLTRLCGRCGARFLATAHTADDQAETLLHRIVRGTGIRGLAGIAPARRLGDWSLVRPILWSRRSEVLEYLRAINQPFREDASNADRSLTRNRIRHDVLPLLAAGFNHDVVAALARLAEQAREVRQLLDQWVEQMFDDKVEVRPAGIVRVARRGTAKQPSLLLGELMTAIWRDRGWPQQSMTYRHWRRLAAMLQSGRPRQIMLPGAIVASVDADFLTLAPPAGDQSVEQNDD